jgi:hypothetical protein
VIQINSQILTYHPMIARDHPTSAFMMNLGAIDFQLDPDFQFQVQSAIQLHNLKHQFQAIYLDASRITAGTTYVNIGVTDQTIGIKFGFQGYFPIVANPGSQTFTFSNPDANGSGVLPQVLRAILLNVPVVSSIWNAAP